MATPLITGVIQEWYCPNCKATGVTNERRPHQRFHPCAGLRGILAPLVEASARVQVTAVEREDYVGSERAQTDENGRPVMAVKTEYADGHSDVAVLAPVATGRGD
jgi:hypothetical protein